MPSVEHVTEVNERTMARQSELAPRAIVTSSVGAGKIRRMRRIFRDDGRTVMVAMDHAAVTGVGPRYGPEIADIARARPDAILASWHLARSQAELFGSAGLVLRLDGGITELGPTSSTDVSDLLCGIEDALRVGADAVIVLAYPGKSDEHVSLTRLAKLCAQSEQYGMPVVAETIPGGWERSIEWTVESISRAARVCSELGADVIKTVCPADPSDFGDVVRACPVPVIALGGPLLVSEEAVLGLAKGAVDAGAAGVAFGRNVWAAANPGAMVHRLHLAVHGRNG